jgi:cysteine desulfurase family protein
MVVFAEQCGVSPARGSYTWAKDCERMIAMCRERVAQLIHAEGPERVVFTMNGSESLNIVLHGLLNIAPRRTHVVATAMEHNSVLRPLKALADQVGIVPEFVRCDSQTGLVDPDDVGRAIRPETRLVVCIHVSNVTGTIQPVAEVARIARERGIPCLIDAAQSAGHVDVNVREIGADFVAFPGHKGLLGPLGTGCLYVRPGSESLLKTIKEGGTGTASASAVHPSTMPEKFEAGSPNAIGIAGLSEGVAWILERGIEKIREHDMGLCRLFLELASGIERLKVYGPRNLEHRTGVFSVNVDGLSPSQLASTLEQEYGILTRQGLHCAPMAHQTIGTYPAGTCRLSFGPFTTEEDIRYACSALATTAKRRAPGQ